MTSLEYFRELFLIAMILQVEPISSYFTAPDISHNPNKCYTRILPENKVVVSWSINIAKLTPDSYEGICFGKVENHGELSTTLCWNKTSKVFASPKHSNLLFSWRKENRLSNPQAKENPNSSVTVSVEISRSTRNAGHMVFWDVQWAEKMHNRVIDEMLYCTYRVEDFGCGAKAREVLWGTKSRPGAWRWQVSLKHRHEGHLCGGSVIAPQWIVTAAHCFDGHDHNDFTIVAGEQHLYTKDGNEQEVSIQKLLKHPGYNMSSIRNYDMALLKLNKSLQYNDRVAPVCLPESHFEPGAKCFVTGWGKSRNSAKWHPKVLKQAEVPIVSRISCKKSYKELKSVGYRVTKRMRCAGFAKGGLHARHSDGGGPLVCKNNRKWQLLGVASWGASSGQDGYRVFADVLKLNNWIHRTMRDS